MSSRNDWYCPGCQDLQFGRNLRCRQCDTPNPRVPQAFIPPPSTATGSQPEEKASKRARVETKLERHVIDLPKGADVDFLKKLLDKASTFHSHLSTETGCQCRYDDDDRSIVIKGEKSALPRGIDKIDDLFHAKRDTRKALLTQFTNSDWKPGFDRGGSLPDSFSGVYVWGGDTEPEVRPAVQPEPEDLVPRQEVVVSQMDEPPYEELQIPPQIAPHLMTHHHKKLIVDETGTELEWIPSKSVVILWGPEAHVQAAVKLVQRVTNHCRWGSNEGKVTRILKPKQVEAVSVRLSPMSTLPSFEKQLTVSNTMLTIGKEKSGNDVFILDGTMSRQHCIIELDMSRGAVYIIDTSTNGTFLNGERLPAKASAKVLLSHGDELLLKDQSQDPNGEFGWVVNMTDMRVKSQVVLQAPRRLGGGSDAVFIDKSHCGGYKG
eukprot:gnl/MRDRNA2_/MRDRNA2_85535_c0_seq2.p1 gnl/MRDRNA2_/MRDRNA2_85535_c0~~gnl/MRDRNA2_/MRDRNA2_85535_c0_seq2.p1  ORF type:complete len:434 (-),score=66.98 gnl/MRDRNA2_/MRDRNA2_85535_c0_seq2:372-1673(-)